MRGAEGPSLILQFFSYTTPPPHATRRPILRHPSHSLSSPLSLRFSAIFALLSPSFSPLFHPTLFTLSAPLIPSLSPSYSSIVRLSFISFPSSLPPSFSAVSLSILPLFYPHLKFLIFFPFPPLPLPSYIPPPNASTFSLSIHIFYTSSFLPPPSISLPSSHFPI